MVASEPSPDLRGGRRASVRHDDFVADGSHDFVASMGDFTITASRQDSVGTVSDLPRPANDHVLNARRD
jgi:hypothetical protein